MFQGKCPVDNSRHSSLEGTFDFRRRCCKVCLPCWAALKYDCRTWVPLWSRPFSTLRLPAVWAVMQVAQQTSHQRRFRMHTVRQQNLLPIEHNQPDRRATQSSYCMSDILWRSSSQPGSDSAILLNHKLKRVPMKLIEVQRWATSAVVDYSVAMQTRNGFHSMIHC